MVSSIYRRHEYSDLAITPIYSELAISAPSSVRSAWSGKRASAGSGPSTTHAHSDPPASPSLRISSHEESPDCGRVTDALDSLRPSRLPPYVLPALVVACAYLPAALTLGDGPAPAVTLVVYSIAIVVLQVGYFGWMVASVTELNRSLPDERKLPVRLLRRGFFFAASYMAALILLLWLAGLWIEVPNDVEIGPGAMLILFPAHAFVALSNVYSIASMARALHRMESLRSGSPRSRVLTFMLLFLALPIPIGPWWVQRRIRLALGVTSF